MTLNIYKTYQLLFTFFLLLISSNNLLGNNSTPVLENESNFKSKELIDKGITKQLEFLIGYNKENLKNNTESQNWYVYIVGEDRLDFNLFENLTYVESQLDLSAIGLDNTPLDIEKLNEKLIEVNKLLSNKNLPLIYYGVANRKKAIPAPFFPNEEKFNASTTDSNNSLLKFYFDESFVSREANDLLKVTNNLILSFIKNEKEHEQEELLAKTLSKAGNSGAIALSTYYLALIKDARKSEGGKAKLMWWSFNDHTNSTAYFNENPIHIQTYEKHLKSLSNANIDKNYVRINAWYNYLTEADIPESEFLTDKLNEYLNNPECNDLSIAEAEQLKNDFIAKVTNENKDEIIASINELCPAIVLEVDYKYIIKAIKLIANETIKEKGEFTVLALMYGLKAKDYGSFFADLKADNNTLLNTLLMQMDNASINPYDKDHYSSFITQLLYIGNQNNGEYLKKERVALIEALLNSKTEINDLNKGPITETLAKVVSFSLSSDESDFSDYLLKNDSKMMLELLALFTKNETSLFKSQSQKDEDIRMVADAWGKFFSETNNSEVYIKLLEIAFSNENGGFAFDINTKDNVAKVVLRMMKHLPNDLNELYRYFTETDENGKPFKLKTIIKKASRIDYELYGDIFYNGLTKILDSEDDIQTRLEIVKWAINDDDFFNGLHENMVVNIFKNIEKAENKKLVYEFLTYKNGKKSTGEKNYEYFSKITDQGILSGTNEQVEFVEFYVSLINEEIGSVEDRIGIIQKVIEKGDDWSMLWLYNDSEDIISSLFTNLKGSDTEYIVGELKKDKNILFRNIWKILQSVHTNTFFDGNNKQLSKFVLNISKILKLSGEEKKLQAPEFEEYLDKNHHYLNNETSQLPKIKGNYIPMARSSFYSNNTDGKNTHILEAELDLETTGKVNIDLTIGQNKIIDKSFDPFEYVYIEFLEETIINSSTKFAKGDIVGVPAFYLAWMGGSIDSDHNAIATEITMDAFTIVASGLALVYSGGSLTPFLAAAMKAEIVFSSIHIPLTIYKDGAKETFGDDFVMALEIGYLITSLVTLPDALITLPKNLVSLTTSTKNGAIKVIDLTNRGILKAGIKLDDLAYKTLELTIDIQGFAKVFPDILKQLKNKPVEKAQLFNKLYSIESQMRTKISNISGGASAKFVKVYTKIFELTKALYVAQLPKGLAAIVNTLPDTYQATLVDKMLVYKFNGKTVLGIDPQGVLHHVKKYKETENYTNISEFEATIKIPYGDGSFDYSYTVITAKNEEGIPVFRFKTDDAFVVKEKMFDNLKQIEKLLDHNDARSFIDYVRNQTELLVKYPNLSIEEIASLKLYTASYHNSLNRALRGNHLDEFTEALQSLITTALKKLPQYNSRNVFRLVKGKEAKLSKTWKVGDNVNFKDFKSTSEVLSTTNGYNITNNSSRNINYTNGEPISITNNSSHSSYNVVYEIINPKGANITELSARGDLEVLLYPNQEYKVISIEKDFKTSWSDNVYKVTLQTNDGTPIINPIKSDPLKLERSIPDHVWPPPYPPVSAGEISLADLQRIKIDQVTGAVQSEVKQAIIDRKVKKILAIIEGESGEDLLPIVKMVPDPNVPGGLILIDQTHTYTAYKQLGFDEIPASIYNETHGVPKLIKNYSYKPDNYAPIGELKIVPEFTGTPSEQAAKRRAANKDSKSDDIVSLLNNNFTHKELNNLILKKFDENNGGSLTDNELITAIQKIVKESNLPDVVKQEIAKIDDITTLSNVMKQGGENLLELAYSKNPDLVKYTTTLIQARRTNEISDHESFISTIEKAEEIHKLPVVKKGANKNNNAGNYSTIVESEYEGKQVIIKYDRLISDENINELESVVKDLEPYGGAKLYGRVRVQEENGIWREALAIEKIEGYDMASLFRLEEKNIELPIEVTQMHLKAIDRIVERLKSEGNILSEVNLGDFMLTNNPDRPVVLLDMFVDPGTNKAQGLLEPSGNPIRNAIDELIQYSPIKASLKYEFETEGYEYITRVSMKPRGIKRIEHIILKDGEMYANCGYSKVYPDGILDNKLDISTELKEKEVFKAIYDIVLKENSTEIISIYTKPDADDFLNAYNKTSKINESDKVNAAYSTSEGILLKENGWLPTEITVDERLKTVLVTWRKKTNNVVPLTVKNPKYQFESEGYEFKSNKFTDDLGLITYKHNLKKDGAIYFLGESKISPNGILYSRFLADQDLQEKGIFKAIYNNVLNKDIKGIEAYYTNEEQFSLNLSEFMKEYKKSGDLEKAAMATPEGKVIGNNWKPTNIEIIGEEVSLRWVKRENTRQQPIEIADHIKANGSEKGTPSSIKLQEPWINSLPDNLKSDLFADKEILYPLFNNADAAYREKLIKSWKLLEESKDLRKIPNHLEILSNVAESFTYKGEYGFEALKLVVRKSSLLADIKLIEYFDKLDKIFNKTLNLPINITCIKRNNNDFSPIIIDGVGDEVIGLDKYIFIKKKFFEDIKLSDKKVGNHEGTDIYKRGNEIGFKTARIIQFNSTPIVKNLNSKELNNLILKKFDEYNASNLTDNELITAIHKIVKESNFPDGIKQEIEKINDITTLFNIVQKGGENLLELANSKNPDLVKYATTLIQARRTNKISDHLSFVHSLEKAEELFKLPTVKKGGNSNNDAGGLSTIVESEYKGKQVIIKYDRLISDENIDELESVVKGLEPYGGAKLFGRVRIQEANGIWREALAIEKIDGYDLITLFRLKEKNKEFPIKVTQKHLKAIDQIIKRLKSEGNILTEVNLGDFMLTNDPNRPVVLLDMFVVPGTRKAQGLLDINDNSLRNTIEEYTKYNPKKLTNNTSFKYKFEAEGYQYEPNSINETGGSIKIEHFIKKEGRNYSCGHSTISADGTSLENTLYEPVDIKDIHVFNAIYDHIINNRIIKIPTEYPSDEIITSTDYINFMKVYRKDKKNEVEVILATQEGIILGEKGWLPTEIKINDQGVFFTWVKKGTKTQGLIDSEEIIKKIKPFFPDCN